MYIYIFLNVHIHHIYTYIYIHISYAGVDPKHQFGNKKEEPHASIGPREPQTGDLGSPVLGHLCWVTCPWLPDPGSLVRP